MSRWSRLAAAMIPVALVATLLAPAASATHRRADQALPFRATIAMSATGMVIAPPGEKSTFGGRCSVPSEWVISFTGSGSATHLGSFTFRASHCTQVGATINVSDGRASFVAASGDVLWEDYGDAAFSFPSPSLACATTHASFTGGTGRFAGVSGSAVEVGCFDLAGGPMVVDLRMRSTGTISYDASDRATGG
jgi:hypothetical protein